MWALSGVVRGSNLHEWCECGVLCVVCCCVGLALFVVVSRLGSVCGDSLGCVCVWRCIYMCMFLCDLELGDGCLSRGWCVCDVVWVRAGVFVGCLVRFSPFIVCTGVFGDDVVLGGVIL